MLTDSDALPTVYDILIIGAGPCGLATAARLREKAPSALFTDEEHRRYHWINRHAGRAAIKSHKTGQTRTGRTAFADAPSMLVLDKSGTTWMSQWNRLFRELEITHLRSPMFFHVDPNDRDGLLAFTHEEGRERECVEIAGCVGKEYSKHQAKKKRRRTKDVHAAAKPIVTIDERDRKDYYAPSSDLFREHCVCVAQRYGLLEQGLVRQACVLDVDFDLVPAIDPVKKHFTVKTDHGKFFSRSVVLAIGAGNMPSIPAPFTQSTCECAGHAFEVVDRSLPSSITRKCPNVLVVGGGLTSAQVVDRAIRQGAEKVWHVMRGPLRVKPFDVDLSWMGKFKNHEKATFWSADTDEDRAELIRKARGGGSITPRYVKILQQHQSSGRLSLHPNTIVSEQEFDSHRRVWIIKTEPAIPDLPMFDHVFFATGLQSDIGKLDFMQTMLTKHEIQCINGSPALTDDLMWTKGVPLFCTGRFANLRLGPGAGNLEGARSGAERIAWALEDVLKEDVSSAGSSSAEIEQLQHEMLRYQIGLGSRYEALAVEA